MYFSLPGELQIQIMKLVLVPGQVHLPQMPATRYDFWLIVPRQSPEARAFGEWLQNRSREVGRVLVERLQSRGA